METIRLGLVGAGGRGGGAVINSLSVNENVILHTIADVDGEKTSRLVSGLSRRFDDRIDVPESRQHADLDGYQKILNDPAVDIVLFATPPGFRPRHILEAVQAGKHVFAEKPVCVDPAGYHICLKADQLAKDNQTSIVTGTQYRRQRNYVAAMSRIHAGDIGDIVSATSRYCSNGIWYRSRPEDMPDTQWQLRNWMHFIWLSGDQITEQAVHNIDVMNWLMGGPPKTAFGSGGRFTRPDDSEMWDSMSIDYNYPGDRVISFKCRQIPSATSEVQTVIAGTHGSATIKGSNGGATIRDASGNQIWSMDGNIGAAYEQEHKDLVTAIRNGRPIVELKQTADSSLTAVMGRLAAYTGQRVDWDFVSKSSKLDLFPKSLDLAEKRSSSFAIPGQTKLV
ncbi:MAG: Gfo/Idh/MocA family oxidoreductase [Planctomycetota bacterium]